MRIVILTQYYPPEIGAPQRRLSGIAERFVAHGHETIVLTAMPSYPKGKVYPGYGGLLQREERNGVQVIHTAIYPTQKANLLPRLMNYFSFVVSSSIFGCLLLKKPDVLIVESPPLFLGLAGFWLALVKRTRVVFNVSDLWPESAASLGVVSRDSLQFRMSLWLEGFFYRKSWLVAGQAKSILSDIQARYPEVPTYLLSNGVDTSKYGTSLRTPEIRAQMGDEVECVALYAGLHGLAQGLNQVLEVAQRILPDGGCRFVLIGDGPCKRSLQEKAAKLQLSNTTFLESLPAKAMPEYVASADIILVTLANYIKGAVPSKLYEAMASSRPVLLVAEGEAADIVRTYNAGMVVKPGDLDGMTQAIRYLRDNPQARQEMGGNGRRAAEEHFDSVSTANQFVSYLEGHIC
ncbi:MAG TPA: glycosyltransferase WbuB [Syntrophobacteraceae bacterium]|jgi:colanic acid biosynthesis glycosyl transferase WcaI|nr:glycosyltransferase WbuB [Syntrophobacteraceae bacterium]